jgi:hypothetical protein
VVLGLLIGSGVAVLRASPSGVEAELAAMASTDVQARSDGIAQFKARGASAALAELESNPSPLLRASLVEAVRLADPTAQDVAALRRLLRSSRLADRVAAVHCVSQHPSLLRADLKALVANRSAPLLLRKAAADALGQDGTNGHDALRDVALSASEDVQLRREAVRALARSSAAGATVVRKLVEDASTSDADRMAGIRALGAAGVQARAALGALATNATAMIREYALAALGQVGDARDVNLVAGMMAVDAAAPVRLASLTALIDMGADGAQAAAVAGRLADGDVRIQALAAESLGRTKALAYVGIQPALAGLLASGNFMVRYKAALAMFAYGDNGGAATMAADAAAGPADQRKLAAQAYTTLTANGNG